MEYYIITANKTSWNLIINNLMLSTNQLPKQGSYLQTLLTKLILLLEEKPLTLFLSFVDKISEEVEFNCTLTQPLYFLKLGYTYSANEPNTINFLLIRFHSFTRNLSIFNCRVSLESVIFKGTKYKENKLKAVFNITIICKLRNFASLQWVILNICFCKNGNTYISKHIYNVAS